MRRRLGAIVLQLVALLALVDSQIALEDSRGVWRFGSTGVTETEEREMSGAARAVVKKVLSVEQAEGVGARVRRSVGRAEVSSSPAHLEP